MAAFDLLDREFYDRGFYEHELDEEKRLYDLTNPVCRYYHISRKERIEEVCRGLLSAREGPRVAADIGCGTGCYLPALASVASQVVGVEIARSKARVAGRRMAASNAEMIVGSATRLPIATSRCHVVLCSEVIEHFTDPDAVLTELFRITAHGGCVVLSTPVRYDPATWLRGIVGRRNRFSLRRQKPDEHGHYWYFAPSDLEQKLMKLRAEVISFAVVPRIHFRGLPRLLRHGVVSPELLLALGRRLSPRGALGDLGAFGIFVARKLGD